MKLEKYYEREDCFQIGTLPDRAYHIPYENESAALAGLREDSGRYQSLNGRWRFRYYKDISEVEEESCKSDFDYSNFGYIDVPGCWQMQGYGDIHYARQSYLFPIDPPFAPMDNDCGMYIREFDYISNESLDGTELVFEGVSACFYVWVNGEFVGYAQGSHSVHIFDVKDKLVDGRNRIAVLDLRYCFGVYYETHRNFRLNGIFRDVYLLKRPKTHIYDYEIRQTVSEDEAQADIDVTATLTSKSAGEITVSLLDDARSIVASAKAEAADRVEVRLTVPQPKLWTAETPHLYTLLFTYNGEIIPNNVGIRTVAVENGRITVNGKPIKLHGVNRQDMDAVKGYVVGRVDIEADLRQMKRHNVNAIRFNNYPCHPLFLEYCDKYGFYVMSEAEVANEGITTVDGIRYTEITIPDTIGACAEKYSLNQDEVDLNVSHFSVHCPYMVNIPEHYNMLFDRIHKMVMRDRNASCVIFWSLGDNSAWGASMEKAAAWIKQSDPSRLLHYESTYPSAYPHWFDADFSVLDVISRKYPSTDWIKSMYGDAELEPGTEKINPRDKKTEQWFATAAKTKPLVLCEYSHAMGNSCGDLEDYHELMQRYDMFCGGFVWEWRDQAVYAGKTADGQAKYLYSSDFDDLSVYGNMCADGLNNPELKAHSSLLEFKNVMRPARISRDGNTITITNMLDFCDLKDVVDICYTVNVNGVATASGVLAIPSIPPHGSVRMPAPFAVDSELSFVRFSYIAKNESISISKGSELGFDELRFGTTAQAIMLLPSGKSGLQILDLEKEAVVCGENSSGEFRYTYNKKRGMLESVVVNDQELFERAMDYNIWRAPTDNDKGIDESVEKWKTVGYDMADVKTYGTEIIAMEDGSVKLKTPFSVIAVYWRRAVEGMSETIFTSDGAIELKITINRQVGRPTVLFYLPRFGIRMYLKENMDRVKYFGYGPGENYIDKHHACWHDMFDSTADGLYEDYIRPQENGSHADCSYMSISDGTVRGMTLTSLEKNFCFNVSHYSQEQLAKAAHNFELNKERMTIVCVDYAQSGIGSNSLGPALDTKYRFDERDFVFRFKCFPTA